MSCSCVSAYVNRRSREPERAQWSLDSWSIFKNCWILYDFDPTNCSFYSVEHRIRLPATAWRRSGLPHKIQETNHPPESGHFEYALRSVFCICHILLHRPEWILTTITAYSFISKNFTIYFFRFAENNPPPIVTPANNTTQPPLVDRCRGYCGIQWCDGYGMLLILTLFTYIGLLYYQVIKPRYGRRIYNESLKPIHTTLSVWLAKR